MCLHARAMVRKIVSQMRMRHHHDNQVSSRYPFGDQVYPRHGSLEKYSHCHFHSRGSVGNTSGTHQCCSPQHPYAHTTPTCSHVTELMEMADENIRCYSEVRVFCSSAGHRQNNTANASPEVARASHTQTYSATIISHHASTAQELEGHRKNKHPHALTTPTSPSGPSTPRRRALSALNGDSPSSVSPSAERGKSVHRRATANPEATIAELRKQLVSAHLCSISSTQSIFCWGSLVLEHNKCGMFSGQE